MYFTSVAHNTEEGGMHCIFGFNFELSDGLGGGGNELIPSLHNHLESKKCM